MKTTYTVSLVVLLATACASTSNKGSVSTNTGPRPADTGIKSTAVPVADSELGLSKTSVFDVPTPDPLLLNEAEPGDAEPLPLMYDGAPPVVPHAIADMLPIGRDDNPCMDCHDGGEAKAPPQSHYTDLRHAPGKVVENLVGARFVCVSCHVQHTSAAALVANEF